MTTIITIILTIVQFIFSHIGDKKEAAKAIAKWINVMRSKFAAAPETKDIFDTLWKKAANTTPEQFERLLEKQRKKN